jgi:hypothetical protein
VTELAEQRYVGSILALQLAAGFALTIATIRLVPLTAAAVGWRYAMLPLAVGPLLGCDSSKNKHASRHAREHAPLHQIIRSVEPGEDWPWCYPDQTLVAPSSPGV